MAGSMKGKSTGRKPRLSDEQLADRLAGEAGVMAFRRMDGGGMVVVNGRGQKHSYSATSVRACRKDASDGTG
jgi:hypothetical protein